MQFLASMHSEAVLYLIDGDVFEERDRDRVLFDSYGNKAVAKAEELAKACRCRLAIIPVPKYVTPRNARHLITEGDVILLSVDNHATRKLVSNRLSRLKDATLISGGNDGVGNGQRGTYGNVQVFVRHDGRDITNTLTRFHPEIARPKDKRPDELGCSELTQSAPQLLFTNLAVASAMLAAFYAWHSGKLPYEELYLDILKGSMVPVKRRVPR